jgi:hypothetical protein
MATRKRAASIRGSAKPSRKPNRRLRSEDSSNRHVFISHDHRDGELAAAFALLLGDASAGLLRTFRSSDRTGTEGIDYGREWYQEIMGKLRTATDVVALITANSVGRPWILYEAGVAAGRSDVPVLGVVLGISLERANVGPFAQFQNCSDDTESLTGLVTQLIRRNSEANPRVETVRDRVEAFRSVLAQMRETAEPQPLAEQRRVELAEDFVPKVFEEIKGMFREISKVLAHQDQRSTAEWLNRFQYGMDRATTFKPNGRLPALTSLLQVVGDAERNLRPLLGPLIDILSSDDSNKLARATSYVAETRASLSPEPLGAGNRRAWTVFSEVMAFLQFCKSTEIQSQQAPSPDEAV